MQSLFLLFATFLDLSGFENLTGLKDTATIRASLLSYCKKISAKNINFVEMLTHFEFVYSTSIFAQLLTFDLKLET